MAHPAGGREGEEEQEEEEEEGKDPGLDSATIWSFDPRHLASRKYHDEPFVFIFSTSRSPCRPRDPHETAQEKIPVSRKGVTPSRGRQCEINTTAEFWGGGSKI